MRAETCVRVLGESPSLIAGIFTRPGAGGYTLSRMTISDLCCDFCGRLLAGSAWLEEGDAGAIRLFVHPGDPLLRDDQPLLCRVCFAQLGEWIGAPDRADVCAVCGAALTYTGSLHVLEMTGRIGEAPAWQFCRPHGVEILNRFRFIDPKMTPADLALKADFPAR